MKVRTKFAFFIYLFYISKSINRPIYLYKNFYPLYKQSVIKCRSVILFIKKNKFNNIFFL